MDKILLKKDEIFAIIDNICSNNQDIASKLKEEIDRLEQIRIENVSLLESKTTFTTSTGQKLTPQEAFEIVWKAYPGRKINKAYAYDCFIRRRPDVDKCLMAFNYFLKNRIWKTDKDNIQYIPHLSTFINRKMWKDVQNEVTIQDEVYKEDVSFDTCNNGTKNN